MTGWAAAAAPPPAWPRRRVLHPIGGSGRRRPGASEVYASQAEIRAAIEEAYADDDPAFGLECDRVAEN
eukprot:1860777-Pleurochrysis_carterae.AAC.1